MIKQKIIAFAISLIIFSSMNNAVNAKTWNFENIGKTKLPEVISIDEGEQKTLSFEKFGGIKKFFIHSGAMSGHYYTMTYNKPPHYSYGWATSQVLGLPYLLENNLYEYKNAPIEEKFDAIAHDLNLKIAQNNAFYKNQNPLKKIKRNKNYCWEGTFSIPRYEKGIVYNEEYQLVLQHDKYQIYLGIVCYDGDIRDMKNIVSDILVKREFK